MLLVGFKSFCPSVLTVEHMFKKVHGLDLVTCLILVKAQISVAVKKVAVKRVHIRASIQGKT
jgi:hypothetical protein